MSRKFNIGDKLLSLETNRHIFTTKNVIYTVLDVSVHHVYPFIFIQGNDGIIRELNEKRFCLDTPENRRKLQIEIMFEKHG